MKLFSILVLSLLTTYAQANVHVELDKIKPMNKATFSHTESPYLFTYFWATWCEECKEKFNDYFPQHVADFKIPVVAVNTDSSEKRVENYLEKTSIPFPVMMDTDKKLRLGTQVNAVPGWALLKKNAKGEYEVVQSKNSFDKEEVLKLVRSL
jgi:hypothetical protein